MNDNAKTIVFAAVLGLVCSVLLTLASTFTKPYRTANEEAEEKRNILEALNVPVPEGTDSRAVLDIFMNNVKVVVSGGKTIYRYIPADSQSTAPLAAAVPFAGPGLWAPIRGTVALEPDMLTIRGIRFFQQEETPGLGGEIGSEWFQAQFVGKKFVDDSGIPGFRIVKPSEADDQNSVHGITAATMTSQRVATMLDLLGKDLATERSGDGS